MKKITFLIAALVCGSFAFSQNTATQTKPADAVSQKIEFKNAEYNMGKITFGKPVEYVVEMKNISQDTITLASVQPACGCTAPTFTPNEKIAPGQTSKITIHYSSNTMGPFTKPTTIYFAGGLSKQVTFTGEGIPEQAPAAATAAPAPQKSKVVSN